MLSPFIHPSLDSQKVQDFWKYRGFIYSSVLREFQARYKGSLLGIGWAILNPIAMILVYTLIFSQIMRPQLKGNSSSFAYSIFLMSGLLPWGLLVEMLQRGQSVFIDNANFIKKVRVPKLVFPIIVLCNALINFSIIFLLFLFFLIAIGYFPVGAFWSFIPLLLLQIALIFGLSILLGVLNVFFRDVGQFIGIFLQFWFWLTPIVYSSNVLPLWVEPYLFLNPMFPIVAAYQHIFLFNQAPSWPLLLPSVLMTLVINGLAWRLFSRCYQQMADEL
jgi:lipopolysaccharide transport system permease protein